MKQRWYRYRPWCYIHLQEVKAILNATELCIRDVLKWSSSRRLKLQGAKTEIIVIDRAGMLGSEADLTIQIDGVNIVAVSAVRDLGITLDARFSMKSHIANTSRACYYHLRRLRQIRSCLYENSAKTDACSGTSPVQTRLLQCCAGRPPGGHTTAVHQSSSHSCMNCCES
jgi:hypothetical protein